MDAELSVLAVAFLVTVGFAVQSVYQCWIDRKKSSMKVVANRSTRGIRARVAISTPSTTPFQISYAALPVVLIAVAASLYPSIAGHNHVDMGFGVVHPVDECVRGETTNTAMMSMKFICTDPHTVEMRMYEKSDNCDAQ